MFKTKFTIIITLFTLLISSPQTYSQSYSVWLIDPSNGQTVANVFSQTQVAVNVTFNASGTRHQYHRAWKFILRTNVGDYTLTYEPIPYPPVIPPLSFPTVYTPSGNLTWTLEMREVLVLGDEYLRAQTTVNFNIKFTIYAKNNFSGGQIMLEGSQQTSGASVLKFAGESVSVSAIDQNDGVGYDRIWNTIGNNSNWKIEKHQGTPVNIYGATTRSYNYTVSSNDNGAALIADLKKIFNVNFQNSFTGVGNVGVIRVNQTQYNSPTSTFYVLQTTSINAEAVDQTLNGINYTFTNWSEAGGSNRNWTFNPTDHKTYTAYFSGTPQPPSIAFNLTQNQPIRFTWTANPNNNVTYQVWRDIYHKATGWTHGWHQIATLPSGSNSYTDGDYIYGWG
jgi:hypothetical protein